MTEGCPGTVDELLIYLVHRRAAPEQEVAAGFQLEHGILILKAAALAVLVGQRKTQAGRVYPAFAELAEMCDGFDTIELAGQSADCGKIATLDKAVAVLDNGDPLAVGLALDSLVTVQDHLRTKWRIAADSDCYMTPLTIDQVEVEMPDIWPALAMADLGDPAVAVALDLPYRGWSVALDDEKQSVEFRIVGQVRLRQLMLTITGVRLSEGNALLGAECMEAARKRPSHPAQMLIV